MERLEREPCPYRLVDDAGGAFIFGLVGGTIWHTIGGARNAPRGQMIAQAISRAKARVPIIGGSFAIWGVFFSGFDCTLVYLRKKEDPWNAIMAGAATGGVLAARAGLKAAGRSAVAGGVILAAIEGLNILVARIIMPRLEKQAQEKGMTIDRLEPPNDPYRPRTNKRQPLWQQNAAPSPLYSTPTAPTWENSGFPGNDAADASAKSGLSTVDSGNSSSSSSSSSSWKFW